MKKLALLALAACLAGACASSSMGKPIDMNRASQFQVGKTTEAEVRAVYGEPQEVMIKEGKRGLAYYHSRADVALTRIRAQGQGIAFIFGPDGKLLEIRRREMDTR
jgi:hypothetical protein